MESKLLALAWKEPPVYSALNRYCHNEVCRVCGHPTYIPPLHFHHLLFMNLYMFPRLSVI